MILVNNLRKSTTISAANVPFSVNSNAEKKQHLITNLNKQASPINLSSFKPDRPQTSTALVKHNSSNSSNKQQHCDTNTDKSNDKQQININKAHKPKRVRDQQLLTHEIASLSSKSNAKRKLIETSYEMIKSYETRQEKAAKVNLDSQIHFGNVQTCVSLAHTNKRRSDSKLLFNTEKISKTNKKSIIKQIKKNKIYKNKKMVQQKTKKTSSFLLQSSSPSFSASLTSFLKRQIGKSSLTMNSTEIDCVNEKKHTFSTIPDSASTYACCEENSLHSSCSTCCSRSEPSDCSCCEPCMHSTMASTQLSAHARRMNETNFESWLLNSANFLSSTPATHNDTLLTEQDVEQRKRMLKKKTKMSTKTKSVEFGGFCDAQKASKTTSKMTRVRSSRDRLEPRTSSSIKLAAVAVNEALKFEFKRSSMLFNSILPNTGNVMANSNENFNNFGDFLVWYV